jgi:hypothetical protein
MHELPVILTAFANSYDSEYLAYLEKEHKHLREILRALSFLRHVPLSNAERNDLVQTLTQYQKELLILHFGGHADSDYLYFRDGGGHMVGLAENLSLHPQLKLVFLNGCKTQAQAKPYLDAGVPAVIATVRSVGDEQAMQFAELFYTALAKGHTLEAAFCRAKGNTKLTDGVTYENEILNLRGVRLREEQITEVPWRLYAREESILDWKLEEETTLTKTANSLEITGSYNNVFHNLYNSIVHIHGLQLPPITHQRSDEFLETLGKLTYNEECLTELYLFNCDRNNQFNDMQYHRIKSSGHKFYFILSCSSQDPRSLVQRNIFDIWREFGKKTEKVAITYNRTPNGKSQMHIKTLEKGTSLEWLQRDWLDQIESDNREFSVFLEQELPQKKSYHLAAGYEFFAEDWERNQIEPLLKQWLQSFSNKTNTGPQCLFFFIINIESIHCKENLSSTEAELVNCIKELANLFKENTLIVDKLPQIRVRDVKRWVEKMLSGAQSEMLFEIWWKKNLNNLISMPDELLNMKYASSFIKDIYDYGCQNQKTN